MEFLDYSLSGRARIHLPICQIIIPEIEPEGKILAYGLTEEHAREALNAKVKHVIKDATGMTPNEAEKQLPDLDYSDLADMYIDYCDAVLSAGTQEIGRRTTKLKFVINDNPWNVRQSPERSGKYILTGPSTEQAFNENRNWFVNMNNLLTYLKDRLDV